LRTSDDDKGLRKSDVLGWLRIAEMARNEKDKSSDGGPALRLAVIKTVSHHGFARLPT
jgi:hypothetical protein